MTLAVPTSKLEMTVPKSLDTMVGAIVATAFLLFFIILGVFNLFNQIAIIPSIIWLMLIGMWLHAGGKEKGFRRFAIDVLGYFSLNQFIRTTSRESGHNEIQFGYKIFGCRLFYLTIPLNKIESVNWSTGQATSMTGRDMNDWHVFIWHDHDNPAKSQRKAKLPYPLPHPDQDVYGVGPSGRKQEIEAFGHAVVDFLRNSGATLVQGNNECTFVRS